MTKDLTVELLNELFYIDTGTWRLMRKTIPSNRCNKNKMAGSLGKRGYLVVRINKQQFYEHRIIYAIANGFNPLQNIDHIDGNKLNNNPSNLRDVSQTENMQNITKARKHCVSGIQGAFLHKKTGKYTSSITANKVRHYLGMFDTPEQAHAAYMSAKRQMHAFGTQQGVQWSPASIAQDLNAMEQAA